METFLSGHRIDAASILAESYGKPIKRLASRFLAAHVPLRILTQDHSGTHWEMELRRDQFIHFTTSLRALKILASGKLEYDPPNKLPGASGVHAVSTVWGAYVPEVQRFIDRNVEGEGDVVAVLFKTTTKPKIGFLEEVIWDRDVVLKNEKVISAQQAVRLLQRTPLRGMVQGFRHWVTYR